MLCILDRCLVLCDWAAPDGGSARARSLGVGGVVRCDEWELPGQEIYTTVEEAGNWWLRSLYSDQ